MRNEDDTLGDTQDPTTRDGEAVSARSTSEPAGAHEGEARSPALSWRRMVAILTAILLVPILPLLVVGTSFEERLSRYLEEQVSDTQAAIVGGGLLALDIALPVPASTVTTLLGARLGVVFGAFVAWVGTTIGAVCGFALARVLGQVWARRLSQSGDLAAARGWLDRYGPAVLIVARGLPVIGEATVLAMGLYGLRWSSFLASVGAANAVLSLVYAAVGSWASEQGWLPLAVGLVTALPLVPLLAWRWLEKRRSLAEG
ncbi:MAG: TVP38/TMEM64 family protein [Planctomycetales bacterium]|nr:TVP38/TMEM64 family protein [Planctomycetales bacterium]